MAHLRRGVPGDLAMLWVAPTGSARVLRRGGRADLARRYLTDYSRRKAAEALQLGEALLGSVEARTRLIYGIRRPRGAAINTLKGPMPNCLVGADPDKPPSRHRSTGARGLRR